jgi:hypothetical protein
MGRSLKGRGSQKTCLCSQKIAILSWVEGISDYHRGWKTASPVLKFQGRGFFLANYRCVKYWEGWLNCQNPIGSKWLCKAENEREKMESTDKTGLQEVFMIKTDTIDFFAALVRGEGGQSMINGRVAYGDGTISVFHSPAGELEDLRKTMKLICESIADFYCTHVVHQRFNSMIGVG